MSISERKSISKGFSAVGFPEGNYTTPGFSNKYPDNGKPSYGDLKNRSEISILTVAIPIRINICWMQMLEWMELLCLVLIKSLRRHGL